MTMPLLFVTVLSEEKCQQY